MLVVTYIMPLVSMFMKFYKNGIKHDFQQNVPFKAYFCMVIILSTFLCANPYFFTLMKCKGLALDLILHSEPWD